MEEEMRKKLVLLMIILLISTLNLYQQEYKKLFSEGAQLGMKGLLFEAYNYFNHSLTENPHYIPAKRSMDLLNDMDMGLVGPDAVKIMFSGIYAKLKMDWPKALKQFKHAKELSPNYYYAYHNLGVAYQEQGKLKTAISHYQKALSLHPDYPYTYNNLGLAYCSLELYPQSINHYKTAIKLYPDYYKACLNMGVAYSRMGDEVNADLSMRRALEINSNYTLAFQNYRNSWEDIVVEEKERIRELKKRSYSELLDLLKGADWKDRVLIATILKDLKDPYCVDGLLYLLKDANPIVRSVAIHLLGDLLNPAQVPLILEMMKDSDWTVRWETVTALGNIGGDQAVLTLLKALEDKSYKILVPAAYGLGKNHAMAAVTALIKLLNHWNHRVRIAAAWALSKIGDPRAIKPMINLLNDPHSKVPNSVLESLQRLTSQNFGRDKSKWLNWLSSSGN